MRLTRMRRRMRPRGYEGRYQHAIARRGGHRRRRREGTDGAAAGDGAGFRHCCCRFRATKNGPIVSCVMSSCHHGGSSVLEFSRAKEGATYESRFELSSSSQSRNNGKLDNSTAFPTHLVCGRAYPLAVALLLGYRRFALTATTHCILPPSRSLPSPHTIIYQKRKRC